MAAPRVMPFGRSLSSAQRLAKKLATKNAIVETIRLVRLIAAPGLAELVRAARAEAVVDAHRVGLLRDAPGRRRASAKKDEQEDESH